MIYKYTSYEAAIKIIESNSLILTSPKDFNDTFDSGFIIQEYDIKNGLQYIADFQLENEFIKIIHKCLPKEKGLKKIICKRFLKKINRRREHGLKRGIYRPLVTLDYIKFIASLFKFIIPKEKQEEAFVSFKNIKDIINDDGKTNMQNIIENMSNNLLVTCFSKKSDIKLMWAHYGDKNKGVCIEYEENRNLYPISYHKHMKKMNFSKFCLMYNASLLNSSKLDINEKSLLSLFPITSKSLDYKYEEEIRIITTENDERIFTIDINGSGKKAIIMTKPIRVICGPDMNQENKEKLKTICLENNIQFVESIKSKKDYKIIVK